jgi:guanosine-3',5'-bis(diphosphate) 3'-pyrophosphohydrolase
MPRAREKKNKTAPARAPAARLLAEGRRDVLCSTRVPAQAARRTQGAIMAETIEARHRPLLEAVAFAARAHQGQLRKDGRTPYVSHVFRVCLVLRDVFGVTDPKALTAAVLHDTVEDTTTDFDDLQEKFGAEIAGWVAALSKDKRRVWEEREALYEKQLAQAPWQVQVCKLADVFDNLLDLPHVPPDRRARSLRNARRYLDALRANLRPQAQKPWETVAALLKEMEGRRLVPEAPAEP